VRHQAAAAEEARLQALAEQEAQREQITAHARATVASLEQALAEAGEEAARGRDQARHALAEIEARLSHALAEQNRLAALAQDHQREWDRLNAERGRVAADEAGKHEAVTELKAQHAQMLGDLRAQLTQASAEQRRLTARVDEHERDRDRLSTAGPSPIWKPANAGRSPSCDPCTRRPSPRCAHKSRRRRPNTAGWLRGWTSKSANATA